MELIGKLDFLKEELQALKDSGLYNEIRIVESAQGARLVVDGVCVLNLCSNNYLYIEGHHPLYLLSHSKECPRLPFVPNLLFISIIIIKVCKSVKEIFSFTVTWQALSLRFLSCIPPNFHS